MLLALLWAGVVADLSPETVPRLKLAWNYNTNATPPSKRAAQIAAFEATPVLSDGLLYVLTPFNQVIALRISTGKLVWSSQVVHHDIWDYDVASRPELIEIEGESAWPTQPFPIDGVFTKQKFIPRPGWCTEEFRKLRYDGMFTPPSLRGTLLFPGNIGGANWGSGAYDRTRRLLFVAANRLATAVRMVPRTTFDSVGHGETGER